MPVKKVYIGLGSNLEQPLLQIERALEALNALNDTQLITDSGYYSSQPMGPQDQPDYINAVALIETWLEPIELLDCLQKIENEQGRIKLQRWGARTIDLDILLYGDEVINSERLTVPHVGLCERDFVYLPLLRIDSDIMIPQQGSLNDIVNTNHMAKTQYSACYQGELNKACPD